MSSVLVRVFFPLCLRVPSLVLPSLSLVAWPFRHLSIASCRALPVAAIFPNRREFSGRMPLWINLGYGTAGGGTSVRSSPLGLAALGCLDSAASCCSFASPLGGPFPVVLGIIPARPFIMVDMRESTLSLLPPRGVSFGDSRRELWRPAATRKHSSCPVCPDRTIPTWIKLIPATPQRVRTVETGSTMEKQAHTWRLTSCPRQWSCTWRCSPRSRTKRD